MTGSPRRSGILKETLGILHEEEQKEGKEHEHRGRGGRQVVRMSLETGEVALKITGQAGKASGGHAVCGS